MAKLDLENIGNPGSYEPKLRFVVPQGLVSARPDIAVIKVYSMLEYPSNHENIGRHRDKEFIRKELHKGNIDRKNGLGFAIFSEGVLNVSMFGGLYPSLLNPNIYDFEFDSDREIIFNSFFKISTEKAGSYCVWEAKDIVKFETESYARNVLYTGGSVEGKRRFLDERFSGLTSDFDYCPTEVKQSVSLEHLGFGTRAVNSFARYSVDTLGDLLKLSEEEVLGITRGDKTHNSVLSRLTELGYELRKEFTRY